MESKQDTTETGDEEIYREYAKNHKIIITAGSDYHGIKNDTKHGTLGEVYIDGEDLSRFMSAYKEMKNNE